MRFVSVCQTRRDENTLWLIVSLMADWTAIAKARGLDIPEEAVAKVAPILDALERDFASLRPRIEVRDEPAVTLNEGAVLGQ